MSPQQAEYLLHVLQEHVDAYNENNEESEDENTEYDEVASDRFSSED